MLDAINVAFFGAMPHQSAHGVGVKLQSLVDHLLQNGKGSAEITRSGMRGKERVPAHRVWYETEFVGDSVEVALRFLHVAYPCIDMEEWTDERSAPRLPMIREESLENLVNGSHVSRSRKCKHCMSVCVLGGLAMEANKFS